jgi:hypothetical protein
MANKSQLLINNGPNYVNAFCMPVFATSKNLVEARLHLQRLGLGGSGCSGPGTANR